MKKEIAEAKTKVRPMPCCGGFNTHKENCVKLKRECFTNSKERHNPTNRMVAYCFQFHDDICTMFATAHASQESFNNTLEVLESHIRAYKGG